ncbi:MAG: hypothetical protein EOO20_02310 [Chryseobacterium sp.]|nr:MAG: hypothetical protein EOO20_02310 [Chryseobacterium sp.]
MFSGAMLLKSSIVKKVATDAVKAGYSQLLNEYEVYKFLAAFKIVKPTDNQERLYLHTVMLFAALGKHEEYIQLLLLKSSFEAFKQEFSHQKIGEFERELDLQLHINQDIRAIKDWNKIPDGDIDHFISIYNKLIKEVALPSTIVLINGQQDIQQSIETQFSAKASLDESRHQDLLRALDSMNNNTQKDELLKEYEQQISELTVDLENGLAISALDKFLKLKNRIWEKLNDQLKFRLLTNLGICHYNLHNNEEAAKVLIEAYHILPETEISYSNIVNAYMAIDDTTNTLKYLTKFLKKFPNSVSAHACRIKVNAPKETLAQLQKKTPKKLLKNSEIIASLGMAARTRDEYDLAIEFLSKALKANPKDDFIEKHLLQAYLEKYAKNFKVLNLKILDSQTSEDLEFLLELIHHQQEKTKDSEKKIDKINLFLSEGFILSLKKQIPEALAALDRGLYLDPENPNLLKQKGYVYAFNGQVEMAIEVLSKIKDFTLTPDVPSLLAESYRNVGKIDKGIKILEKVVSKKSDIGKFAEHFKKQALHILLDMYILDNRETKIRELRTTKFQEDTILNRLSLARIAYHLGETEKGAENLLTAYSLVNETSTFQEKFFLAGDLHLYKFIPQAINLYSSIADPSINSEPTRILYKLLWHYGQMGQALHILEQLREENGILEGTTRFEIECYQQIANYPKACEIAKAYLDEFPENDEVRLILGGLYYRLDQQLAHARILDTPIAYLELPSDFFQTYLAQLAGLQKREQAITTVYEYQRIKDSQEATTIYQQTILIYPMDREGWAEPNTVCMDSAVTLRNEETEFTIILENRPTNELKKNELNPSHPRYGKVFGKKIGDEVIFGPLDKWQIKAIKPKLKYAFELSRHDMQTVYSDTAKMRYFNFEAIKTELERDPEMLQQQRQASIEAYNSTFRPYKNREIGLFGLAINLRRNIISMRDQVISTKEIGLQCCDGVQESLLQIQSKLEGRRLCADITALLTIFELGMQEQISRSFGKILIVPATVDIVLEAVEENRLYKVDGEPFQRISAFKSFVDLYCEEIFPVGLLQLNSLDKNNADKQLGKSVLDTFLLSSETGCCYLSDDLINRESYKAEHEQPVIWSQQLISYLRNQGVIDKEQYCDCTIELVWKNFEYTSVDSMTLLRAFKLYARKNADKLLACLLILSGGKSTSESGLNVAFHYILLGMKDPELSEDTKNLLTDQALLLFITARNVVPALNMFKSLLNEGYHKILQNNDKIYIPKIKSRFDLLVQKLKDDNFLSP